MHFLPESVRRLIADSIDTIPELEAILLLRMHRERVWSVEDAGARLYTSPTVTAYVLDVLALRGFLEARDGGFRYAPRTPALDDAVAQLADSYSSNLIAVTHLIHTKPAPSVQHFAKAFRLRKER